MALDLVKLANEFGVSPQELLLGTHDVPPYDSKPRLLVKVNDKIWPEAVHATIHIQGNFQQASFDIDFVFTLSGNIHNIGDTLDPESNLAKMVQFHNAPFRDRVQIYGGFSNNDPPKMEELELIFEGVADRLTIDVKNNACTLSGRDLSAIFRESYTHEQFRNTTVNGVIKELAERYDFNADITTTDAPIGTIFDYENISFENRNTDGINNWEILTKLAESQSAIIFFHGQTMYVRPYDHYEKILLFALGVNISDLRLEKNYAISSSRLSLEIASTDVRAKDSKLVTIGPPSRTVGSKGDIVYVRKVVSPNTSLADMGLLAEAIALMYSQQEHVVTITTAGAPQQNLLNKVILSGTGTEFDREYRIFAMKWELGWQAGWQSEITLLQLPKNAYAVAASIRTRYNIRTVRESK